MNKKDLKKMTEVEEQAFESMLFEGIDFGDKEKISSFSLESYDYDFEQEDFVDEIVSLTEQTNKSLSFDLIKLKLSLDNAEYVNFSVKRNKFFRTSTPQIPAKDAETIVSLLKENDPAKTMELSEEEIKVSAFKNIYPDAKPFKDFDSRSLGVGHMYFKNGEFICQINGKISAKKGYLGLINKNNINEVLSKLKSKSDLVDFDNDKFIEMAEVLNVHVTNDIKVSDVLSNIKAFSSYLPIRTDKFNVLKYGKNGYEILPRGKQRDTVPSQKLCIYNKGNEVNYRNQYSYQKKIETKGIKLSKHTLRIELKLSNFAGIRKFFAPLQKNGTVTLKELLNSDKTPILQCLQELGISIEKLQEAKGKRISMKNDQLPKVDELIKIQGLITLLQTNDYSLDRVKSYLETESGRKIRSDEMCKYREKLQSFIACNKPRTVALLTALLSSLSY